MSSISNSKDFNPKNTIIPVLSEKTGIAQTFAEMSFESGTLALMQLIKKHSDKIQFKDSLLIIHENDFVILRKVHRIFYFLCDVQPFWFHDTLNHKFYYKFDVFNDEIGWFLSDEERLSDIKLL